MDEGRRFLRYLTDAHQVWLAQADALRPLVLPLLVMCEEDTDGGWNFHSGDGELSTEGKHLVCELCEHAKKAVAKPAPGYISA